MRDYFKMSDFQSFYNELVKLVTRYENNNTPLKVEKDLENDIIKIYGERITSLARAQNGLNDVSELAFATAEHHPFWNILYSCSEISNTILEKWNGDLLKKDVEDIKWATREMIHTIEKIKEKLPD